MQSCTPTCNAPVPCLPSSQQWLIWGFSSTKCYYQTGLYSIKRTWLSVEELQTLLLQLLILLHEPQFSTDVSAMQHITSTPWSTAKWRKCQMCFHAMACQQMLLPWLIIFPAKIILVIQCSKATSLSLHNRK